MSTILNILFLINDKKFFTSHYLNSYLYQIQTKLLVTVTCCLTLNMFKQNSKKEEGCLAKRFVKYFGHCIKYETTNDCFWICDEDTGIWEKDHQNARLRNKITRYKSILSQEIPYELIMIQDSVTRTKLKSKYDLLLQWFEKSQNVDILIKQIKNQRIIQLNESSTYFNNNPDYILCENGVVLNFRNGNAERYVHPKLRIANNRVLKINFKQINKQEIEDTDSFFNYMIKDKTERQSFINFLIDALFGLNKKRIMINTGGNGKDIFMKIFIQICGTYCLSIQDTLLYNDKTNPSILRKIHQHRIVSIDVANLDKVKPNVIKGLTCTFDLIDATINPEESQHFFYSQASIFWNCKDPVIEFINNLENDAIRNRIMITKFENVNDKDSKQSNINIISYLLLKCNRFNFA